MSCRSKIMREWEASGMGRAGNFSFQKGFNTKILKKSRLNKPLLLPAWLSGCLSDLRHPKFVSPAAAVSAPGAGGLRTGPALPNWGYLLFKAGEFPWDWLIDPNGNDSCPGLLTTTFSPLEKSIPPILDYLLFVKHSWLQVPVKMSWAACLFLCSRSD